MTSIVLSCLNRDLQKLLQDMGRSDNVHNVPRSITVVFATTNHLVHLNLISLTITNEQNNNLQFTFSKSQAEDKKRYAFAALGTTVPVFHCAEKNKSIRKY